LRRYSTTSAPNSTPAALTPNCSSGSPVCPLSAGAAFGVVDAELDPDEVGAVALALEPDAEVEEAEAEDEDGVKDAKERLVDVAAAAQNCSTRASAEATSEGHALRHERKAVV